MTKRIGHFRDHSVTARSRPLGQIVLPAMSNEIGLGLCVEGLPRARRASTKLSEKTQESFPEDTGKNGKIDSYLINSLPRDSCTPHIGFHY